VTPKTVPQDAFVFYDDSAAPDSTVINFYLETSVVYASDGLSYQTLSNTTRRIFVKCNTDVGAFFNALSLTLSGVSISPSPHRLCSARSSCFHSPQAPYTRSSLSARASTNNLQALTYSRVGPSQLPKSQRNNCCGEMR
jgi:hypothetical protein